MKTCALAAAAAALAMCAPAQATEHRIEHRATIDHAVGQIAADYSGKTRVSMQQVGTAGVGGRMDTLRCRWTVSLDVERHARLASGHAARRTLSHADVAKGSAPGWCPQRDDGAQRIAARHGDEIRAALMALVDQDRALILAEADAMPGTPREG